jgi:hypothetical protein
MDIAGTTGQTANKLKTEMKRAKYFAIIAALLALAATQVQAQQTNLVQTLNVSLTGLVQGGTTTNRNTVTTGANLINLGDRDILKLIAAATCDTFSPAAILQLVTPLPSGIPYVQVQDGTNTVGVADFFDVQPLSSTIDTSTLNNKTTRFSATDYYTVLFVLQDGSASLTEHFNVNGLATENVTYVGSTLQGDDVTVAATGTGDQNGQPVIWQGTIRFHGTTLQVINDLNF